MLGPAPARPGPLANASAKLRRELRKAGVRVYRQSLRKDASARSHFAVFCDKWGAPISLWTGSAAWTTRALCLRSNSGILIESVALARAYLDLWDQLRDDLPPEQSRQPKKLSLPVHIRESGMSITLWDTPTPGSSDLRDVIRLVRGARQGIIFIVDGKRVADAVMGEILGLTRDKDLFIEGLSWFRRRGATGPARHEYRVNGDVTVIEKQAAGRPIDGTIVLVDPFGPHPAILTGSHDLSPETSARNQSDLLIIENAPQLASEYAVYVIQLLDHYRWLSFMATRRAPALMGLAPNDAWQGRYFKGTKRSEFNFLFGSLSPNR
jgi:hypothetical protein